MGKNLENFLPEYLIVGRDKHLSKSIFIAGIFPEWENGFLEKVRF